MGLLDDAAVLRPPEGEELVVTADALVAGVHFLPDTPPDLVARKLLRANLSDLAAKAAEPWLWWLTVAWPDTCTAADRQRFAGGLAEDQARFGLRLAGGDTVRTPGPLTVSATLIGRAPVGGTVRRGGARPGDALLVSGAIGDAGLGLAVLTGRLAPRADDAALMVARHQSPEPRLELRQALRAHATAAADVSDGLLADAGRIAAASGVCLTVELDGVPLSPATERWLASQPDRTAALVQLATSGDDYEVVCTCRPEQVDAFVQAAARAGAPLSRIGEVIAGAGVRTLHRGAPVAPERLGWAHR